MNIHLVLIMQLRVINYSVFFSSSIFLPRKWGITFTNPITCHIVIAISSNQNARHLQLFLTGFIKYVPLAIQMIMACSSWITQNKLHASIRKHISNFHQHHHELHYIYFGRMKHLEYYKYGYGLIFFISQTAIIYKIDHPSLSKWEKKWVRAG